MIDPARDIAQTPAPPYYAVIFTSLRTEGDNGYDEMAMSMYKLALEQPGFLGMETVRDGLGISISYWRDEQSILNWKTHAKHLVAQRLGRDQWYSAFKTRVCKVERDYGFEREEAENVSVDSFGIAGMQK